MLNDLIKSSIDKSEPIGHSYFDLILSEASLPKNLFIIYSNTQLDLISKDAKSKVYQIAIKENELLDYRQIYFTKFASMYGKAVSNELLSILNNSMIYSPLALNITFEYLRLISDFNNITADLERFLSNTTSLQDIEKNTLSR
ncbi:hypothetical protein [Psychrosphaera algicola]|uniref:Uncharacterized protein n=1 Tax=Psychrosphaera algicola TaxID=3023714 RepID=A0ABT5FFX1_9GAMM|nr:hypothetical protein [Psychrosphaera sp. G1-22]MDC2890455.1 hypothetical protein [Psychrosphaera sp. G1-22]